MLLVIDVGNTNLSAAAVRDARLGTVRRASTPATATPDEVEALLDGLLRLDHASLEEVDRVALASVVPGVSAAVRRVAERRGIGLLEASSETIGIAVDVESPAEVGPDRLVNAMAASRLYGVPAIVVDLGTATTFDVVDGRGAFVGGAIAPGLEIGLDALAARTAKLPRVEARVPARAIGRSTVAAMQAGAVFGHMGLVRELLERIQDEISADASVRATAVATGGLAASPWIRGLEGIDAVDPSLTLKGLVMLDEAQAAGREAEAAARAGAAVGRGGGTGAFPRAVGSGGASR